MILIQY